MVCFLEIGWQAYNPLKENWLRENKPTTINATARSNFIPAQSIHQWNSMALNWISCGLMASIQLSFMNYYFYYWFLFITVAVRTWLNLINVITTSSIMKQNQWLLGMILLYQLIYQLLLKYYLLFSSSATPKASQNKFI